MRLLAIDPGDKHCGVAEFSPGWIDGEYHVATSTCSPELLVEMLEVLIDHDDLPEVVCEEFRLYPWKSQEQSWSNLRTSRLIGVIEYVTQRAGVPYHEQSASIKNPAFGMMRHKKIDHVGANQHERDAEGHGYYFLWRHSG